MPLKSQEYFGKAFLVQDQACRYVVICHTGSSIVPEHLPHFSIASMLPAALTVPTRPRITTSMVLAHGGTIDVSSAIGCSTILWSICPPYEPAFFYLSCHQIHSAANQAEVDSTSIDAAGLGSNLVPECPDRGWIKCV